MSIAEHHATDGVAARFAPAQVTELDPHPVRRRGAKGLGAHTVWVGAGGRWANPFECGSEPVGRGAGLARFAVWLAGRIDLLEAAKTELAGRDLACSCPLDDSACHRNVLLDVANPPADPLGAGGRAIALTARRPWASLLLVPEALGGKTVENRTWSTDYRGPIVLYSGTRIDEAGQLAAERAGLDGAWHSAQTGWLGVSVLVDVHPARGQCRRPWGYPQRHADRPVYHWVFGAPARLAARTWGRGFVGLRPVSWAVLVRRSARGWPGGAGDGEGEWA